MNDDVKATNRKCTLEIVNDTETKLNYFQVEWGISIYEWSVFFTCLIFFFFKSFNDVFLNLEDGTSSRIIAEKINSEAILKEIKRLGHLKKVEKILGGSLQNFWVSLSLNDKCKYPKETHTFNFSCFRII